MKRLLFVVSEDWYFVSHRLHLAMAASRAGFKVAVLTRVSKHRQQIESAGIELFDWALVRGSRNPLFEIRAIVDLVAALRRFRPDVIHGVALKPVLYSSFASRFVGPTRRAFALGGLGFTLASSRRVMRWIRPAILRVLREALSGRKTMLILQNPHDRELLVKWGVIEAERVRLIRGAGVDTTRFSPHPEPEGVPLIVLPARMLWDKGVGDFVECARRLRAEGEQWRFALVGDPDSHNPESVPETQLQQWADEGIVEWWGRQDDMVRVYAQANVICLPSFHEGLPKSLLEAASCGRAIATYDVPGCREIVTHGENGLLARPRDVPGLAQVLRTLVCDPELRRRMGENGRSKVLRDLSEETVAQQTLEVWEELLA